MNNNNEITYTSWKNGVHPIWATSPGPLPIETFFINAQILVFYNDLFTCCSNAETECTVGFLAKNHAK
jgi:hypothetical protein